MASTRAALLKLGCTVTPGPDGFRSFSVVFPSGRRFNFWPYSGWFAGKTQGRGFENLVKAGAAAVEISPATWPPPPQAVPRNLE
jgi:hypothetical protein